VVAAGTRIYTMRHAFNLREGLNPLARNMPGRIVGEPPLREGNVKDVTVDYRTLAREAGTARLGCTHHGAERKNPERARYAVSCRRYAQDKNGIECQVHTVHGSRR